jgi:hypothetical protein
MIRTGRTGGGAGARRRRPRSRVAASGILCLVAVAAACEDGGAPNDGTTRTGPSAASSPRASQPEASPEALGPPGAPGCRPASPVRAVQAGRPAAGLPEIQGTSRNAQLWGLLMPQLGYPPLRAGQDLKIVWRMTGSGDIRLSVTGPDGEPRRLVFGPDLHGGSTYTRPGEEWGAGYRLTEPGCWHLRAVRGSSVADVWLAVSHR